MLFVTGKWAYVPSLPYNIYSLLKEGSYLAEDLSIITANSALVGGGGIIGERGINESKCIGGLAAKDANRRTRSWSTLTSMIEGAEVVDKALLRGNSQPLRDDLDVVYSV